MIFYVTLSGTRGMPKRFIENVMVSAGSLWSIQCGKFIRRNPPAHTRFFLDSGGFNCLNRFGNYPWSRSDYLDLIWHYEPDYVATMDYPCEPEINRKIVDNSGSCALESNKKRIKRTVENANWLLDQDLPSSTTIVPVIQGFTFDDYCSCIELYKEQGVFDFVDYFAVGSMCRRVHVREIEKLVLAITDYVWSTHPECYFHFFGLKLSALKRKAVFDRIFSIDSSAWSLNPCRGGLYIKNPVGAGTLDLYLSKIQRVCMKNEMQQTLRC